MTGWGRREPRPPREREAGPEDFHSLEARPSPTPSFFNLWLGFLESSLKYQTTDRPRVGRASTGISLAPRDNLGKIARYFSDY